MRRRRDKRIWWAALAIFVAVFLFSFLSQNDRRDKEDVQAASLANFDPGYIISDYQMSNYNSMTEAEIQAFLTAKNPCNNRDYEYYKSLTKQYEGKMTWHWADGHFVCISEEKFGDGEVIGSGETAAHIIWQTAQDYKINPQVLLVLLQKEQSLITDPIPNSRDYRAATGYGCPDTAACASKYYGFKNQVRNAAALFRTVLDGGWTNYPLGNNYIQYNPSAACGGSVVNIRNLATSSLYRYTPYQPNPGALTAGYGTANCGAYGNRNFYLYFQDWFGGITKEKHSLEYILANVKNVEREKSDLDLKYRGNIEDYGWLPYKEGGEMVGTTGFALRLEALEIKLEGINGIEYRSHIQDKGWESDYKKDGEISGSIERSKRLEAIQIRLTGNLAKNYDIYYRTHVEDIGWMDWVKNDEVSGTTGESKRIEAIQIKIVKKDFGINYSVHVQDVGWMTNVIDGELAGTIGLSRRLEAIKISLTGGLQDKDVEYRVHVQDIGWMDWIKNGELAGTTGKSKRLEAIEIKLPQELTSEYDIYYRVHVQDVGWMDWIKNGELAGTTGKSKRLEAIEIKLVVKQAE